METDARRLIRVKLKSNEALKVFCYDYSPTFTGTSRPASAITLS